jgi:hypothetical protein
VLDDDDDDDDVEGGGKKTPMRRREEEDQIIIICTEAVLPAKCLNLDGGEAVAQCPGHVLRFGKEATLEPFTSLEDSPRLPSTGKLEPH